MRCGPAACWSGRKLEHIQSSTASCLALRRASSGITACAAQTFCNGPEVPRFDHDQIGYMLPRLREQWPWFTGDACPPCPALHSLRNGKTTLQGIHVLAHPKFTLSWWSGLFLSRPTLRQQLQWPCAPSWWHIFDSMPCVCPSSAHELCCDITWLAANTAHTELRRHRGGPVLHGGVREAWVLQPQPAVDAGLLCHGAGAPPALPLPGRLPMRATMSTCPLCCASY